MVYQEQLTAIAQAFCGYTYGQADKIRKAAGKKKPEEMAAEGQKFIPAAVKMGHEKELAEFIWHKIETFARYGFNKSHSTGYGKLTYQTAWLKAHYPVEYMAALLAVDGDDEMQVRKYVRDCMTQNIPVLAPHINLSSPLAVPEGQAVRFGLRSIAGIKNGADALCGVRGTEPFTGMGNLVARIHGQMRAADLEKLIKAGCCDEWGSRLGLIKQLHELWKMHDKQAKKAVQAVPLFNLEDAAESQEEAPQFREEDRIQMELELLNGCYREDVKIADRTDVQTVSIVCWTKEMVEQAIQIVRRHQGRTPLNAMFPSDNRHGVWIQLGMIQYSGKVIQALKDLGCEVRQ
jgi:DNA polymerase-3 subunit alpha